MKVAGEHCIHCGSPDCDPAHLIPRSLTTIGQNLPLAVIALCRACHRLYDTGQLDLLPALERHARRELAFAVERIGLIQTLRRVTNQRWSPQPEGAVAA